MIAIVNVSPEFSPSGLQDYELRINAKVIARFQHTRSDGLAECLRRAAVAADEVKKAEWLGVLELLDRMETFGSEWKPHD